LLAYLLALVIPLQGLAASTPMLCHLSGSIYSADQTTVNQHTANQASLGHFHHQVEDHFDHESSALDHQDSKKELVKTAQHKCSACAYCCCGTALWPAALMLVFNHDAQALIASSIVSLGAISPRQLERPPRAFLA